MNSEQARTQAQHRQPSAPQAVPAFLRGPLPKQTQAPPQLVVSGPQDQPNFTFQAPSQVPFDESQLMQELYQRVKEIEKAKKKVSAGQDCEDELFAKIEELTQETKFAISRQCREDQEYVRYWIEYASTVKDSEVVYQHMLEQGIGEQDSRVHVSLAFFYEKFKRDFNLTEQTYQNALRVLKKDSQKEVVLGQFKNFSDRMQSRLNRDVVEKIGSIQFEALIRKRKRSEAFPEEFQSLNNVQQKKMKFCEEAKQYSTSVKEYTDGIKLVRERKPQEAEITIDQKILAELSVRPISWIGQEQAKHQVPSLVISSKSVNSQGTSGGQYREVIQVLDHQKLTHPVTNESFSVDELRAAAYQHKKQQKLEREVKDMAKPVQQTMRSQVLELIGEASMEFASNTSYQSLREPGNAIGRSAIQGGTGNSSFQTANGSLIQNQTFSVEENSHVQIDTNNYQTMQRQAQEHHNDLTSQFQQLLQKMKKEKGDEKTSEFAQQIIQIISGEGIPIKSNNNTLQERSKTEVSFGNIPCTQMTDQVHFNLPPFNFQNMQAQLQAKPNVFQAQEVPQKQKQPVSQGGQPAGQRRSFSNILVSLMGEEGPVKGNETIQPVQERFDGREFKGTPMNKQENVSFMSDISNPQVTPNNFLTKLINPDYSHEHFKKKTGSNFMKNKENQQSMSPFGMVTPIKDESIIGSNVKAYVNRADIETYNWIGDKHQPNNLLSQFQKSSRLSLDSQGQVFQDCKDQSQNMSSIADKGQRLPGLPTPVLKPSESEVNSRTGSKSVRFQPPSL